MLQTFRKDLINDIASFDFSTRSKRLVSKILFLSIPVVNSVKNVASNTNWDESLMIAFKSNSFFVIDDELKKIIQYSPCIDCNHVDMVVCNMEAFTNITNLPYAFVSWFRTLLNQTYKSWSIDCINLKWFKRIYTKNDMNENMCINVPMACNKTDIEDINLDLETLTFNNTEDKILANFKNPLGTFNNFVSFEDDGSFSSEVMGIHAFETIRDYVKKQISYIKILGIIDRIVTLYRSYKSANNMGKVEHVLNAVCNAKINNTNENSSSTDEANRDNNNLLTQLDLVGYVDDILLGNGKNVIAKNLKELMVYRILNNLPNYALRTMSLQNFKKLRVSPTTNLFYTYRTDNNVKPPDNVRELNAIGLPVDKLTVEDIRNMYSTDASKGSDKISIERGDDIDESLFTYALSYIKRFI